MSSETERPAYCAMCAHAAPRHKANGHRRSRFPLVCLVVARAVTARGVPLSVNSEIYPCGYGGKEPLAFERSAT